MRPRRTCSSGATASARGARSWRSWRRSTGTSRRRWSGGAWPFSRRWPIAAWYSRRHERGLMSETYRTYTLVAELTYKCPLRCVYCSNPLDYGRHDRELDTETWRRVFREAEDLGVVQLNPTGGEPAGGGRAEAPPPEGRAA